MATLRRTRTALLIGTAILALGVRPARAQSVAYGELESMFGEPVTTSATGKPQKVSEVPVDMEIITQDDIRRSGADNIPDVLQFVTGINFTRSSFNDPEVSIRGYGQPWNPRMLVLVNGHPVYEDFYGDVVWAALPVQLDEIRQIEVVKGPNSALFGFNAASGVINILTYDPLRDKVESVTGRTGTQALHEGSAVGTMQLGDYGGIRMSAGAMNAHEFSTDTIPAANAAGLLTPKSSVANFDSRWRIGDGVELLIEGSAGDMNRNFPADATPEADRDTHLRAKISAITGLGLMDLDMYHDTWNINYLGAQAQGAINEATDVRASDLFKIGTDHSFRLGLEYKYNQAQGQFFDNSTLFYNVYSASGMWDWAIRPGLTLTNAARNDYLQLGELGAILPETGLTPNDFNKQTLNAVSFNSGLVWAATDQDVIRLMAARGFQLPSLDDLGQQIVSGGLGYVDAGQPHLRPTAVTNYETDYDHTFSFLPSTLRTALFTQDNKDLFGYDVAAPYTLLGNTVYQSGNIGDSEETGIELALKSPLHQDWRWNVGYSWSTVHDHIYASVAPGAYSSFQHGTPVNAIDGGVGYTWGKLELDGKARFQTHWTDFQYNVAAGVYQPTVISDYVTANLHAGYHATDNVYLGATVEQMNRAEIQERASVPVERRFLVSLTVHD